MAEEVSLNNDSKFRVALELTYRIATAEVNSKKEERKEREYWLSLYEQCREIVVEGKSVKSVLDPH